MGYTIKDIAIITEPSLISLVGAPNFVQFERFPAERVYLDIRVRVLPGAFWDDATLRIADKSGNVRLFHGTDDATAVSGDTFLVSTPADTAEALRRLLLADPWVSDRLDIRVPFDAVEGGLMRNGTTLYLTSKGAGDAYDLTVEAPNGEGTVYEITRVSANTTSNDSIIGEAATADVRIDLYADPEREGLPTTPGAMGVYVTSLRKTYRGAPLWFDMNAIFAGFDGHTLPPQSGWFDPGTVRKYRFTAAVADAPPFYVSEALRVLNGRSDVDLRPYFYADSEHIKLLTNKPRTPYVRGQREVITFLSVSPLRLRPAFSAYTHGGRLLGTVYGDEVDIDPVVRTAWSYAFTLDEVLDAHPDAAVVHVALFQGDMQRTTAAEYKVLPECLHSLRPFSFLNRLGGWDVFNFDAPVKEEVKSTVDTYRRTVTPEHRKSVERVHNAELSATYTIEGAPVTDEVAEWLKELADARVVLDGAGDYVIIEEFTLQVTAANKNMHRPTIKYRK